MMDDWIYLLFSRFYCYAFQDTPNSYCIRLCMYLFLLNEWKGLFSNFFMAGGKSVTQVLMRLTSVLFCLRFFFHCGDLHNAFLMLGLSYTPDSFHVRSFRFDSASAS